MRSAIDLRASLAVGKEVSPFDVCPLDACHVSFPDSSAIEASESTVSLSASKFSRGVPGFKLLS